MIDQIPNAVEWNKPRYSIIQQYSNSQKNAPLFEVDSESPAVVFYAMRASWRDSFPNKTVNATSRTLVNMIPRADFDTLLADLEIETKPNTDLIELAKQYKLRLT